MVYWSEFFFLNLNLTYAVCSRDDDAPAKIDDPDALKPEGWLDDELEFVSDPSAEKPDDWYIHTSTPDKQTSLKSMASL